MHDVALINPAVRAWAQASIRKVAPQVDRSASKRKRRFLVVHLDGVPRRLLDEAVQSGRMPFLSRMVKSGAYSLDRAFWGSPASTPFFQAGFLYGLRHPNLPAYSWFDRELQREVKMNQPRDTVAIESRLAGTRPSLLEDGGTTYFSLFRGNASNMLCMSALSDLKSLLRTLPKNFENIRGPARRSVMEYAWHTVKHIVTSLADVGGWVRKVNDWRHERSYFLSRLFLISLGWNLARTRALLDMIAGVPSIYLVFGNFDEVAHRRGPFSLQAREELYSVDAQLEELHAVARSLDEPYDLYLVTDHGHVDSTPFEQRRGQRLREHLLLGPPAQLSPDIVRALRDGRPERGPTLHSSEDPVVIEAGNFSHVYLGRERKALEAQALLRHHSDVIARAVASPAIGLVALRRGDSAVALVGGEVFTADEIDRAPLASQFSREAVRDLLRELPHMPTAGDLVLYGSPVGDTGTVGFAWEFGSHGGLTKIETESVVCWPTQGPVDLGGLTHCAQLHDRLSEAYRN